VTNPIFTDSDIPPVGSSLGDFKQAIKNFQDDLANAFDPDCDIRFLVKQRAAFTDAILRHVWLQFTHQKFKACLIAVGGYGRGELHPASDIDLMILLDKKEDTQTKSSIEQLLMFLWDIGLEVGHSVRTLKECTKEAKADITIATNLMESRNLIGDEKLFESMTKNTGPKKIWPDDKFFNAKYEEQRKRHLKYNDTAYNLEPNIKANPGGLRDIQMIGWVAKRHFGADKMYDLVSHDFLTKEELLTLQEGEALLWKIRYALHILVGRREDRLLFDYQRKLANMFGYTKTEDNQAIEAFMQKYYRTVIELNRLNDMLLQLFQEVILYKKNLKIIPINDRFQSINGYIDVTEKSVFEKKPSALLEIFCILSEDDSLKGIRASTIRLIRESCHLINDDFRESTEAQNYFLSLFTGNSGLTHVLRRMNRYGILASYLPAFDNIVGRMQYDLYHVYTVDEHTLFAIRNLRRLNIEDYHHEFPLSSELIKSLSMPHVVYLAALFHDIAKGRGGDHAELGAIDAYEFCQLHRLSNYESKLVSWLVGSHLLMSMTAQRKDIDDPNVILEFANKVVDPMRLKCLYLLTVADSRATNPSRWNDYKDSLLKQLFLSTLKALDRGLDNPLDQKEIIQHKKDYALTKLIGYGYDEKNISELWSLLNDDFFIHASPDEITWQSKVVLETDSNEKPVIKIRKHSKRGGAEIFVCTEDNDNAFSIMAILLAQLGLKVLSARIHTAANSCTMNKYIVHEQDDDYIESNSRKQEIIDYLRDGLLNTSKVSTSINNHTHRKLKHFQSEPEIVFTQDTNNKQTLLRIKANDKPALLAKISLIFIDMNVKIHSAKIATIGADIEDTFIITDKNNEMISDENQLKVLTEKILETLSAD